jgi:hypothetical protein
MVFLRKIKSGRRSIVWRINGEAQYIDGPKLVFVWPCCNRLQPLTLHQANDMQYLEIKFTDGKTEIQPGPAALFDDPLKISSISTKDLIKLDANEMLILYTQKENEEKQSKTNHFSSLDQFYIHRFIINASNYQRSNTLCSKSK